MDSAAASASSSVWTPPRDHGATGTPTSSAMSLEPILSPSLRMASPEGPMKVMPRDSTRSANAGSSATNPQPTHTASARASVRTFARRSWLRYGRSTAGPSGWASSASRANIAERSASVWSAMVTMGSRSGCSALRSRTAWMRRMAASPRLTMAIRWNKSSSWHDGQPGRIRVLFSFADGRVRRREGKGQGRSGNFVGTPQVACFPRGSRRIRRKRHGCGPNCLVSK